MNNENNYSFNERLNSCIKHHKGRKTTNRNGYTYGTIKTIENQKTIENVNICLDRDTNRRKKRNQRN